MKRLSLTWAVLIPVLILFAGFAEFYLVYYPYEYRLPLDTNLRGFFLNLLFGGLVGCVYLLLESQKEGKWVVDMARLYWLFVPLLIVSIFFVVYPFHRVVITDMTGEPYLNFAEFYYGVRLSAHLAYFCTGFFLVTAVTKKTSVRPGWAWYLCLSAVYIVLILATEFAMEALLSYSMPYVVLSYYWYEAIVLVINLLFGALLSVAVFSPQEDGANRRGAWSIALPLVCLLLGCLPFVFDAISYHTQFDVPYNRLYYRVLGFFRRADFFQAFQIFSGILLFYFLPLKKGVSTKTMAGANH